MPDNPDDNVVRLRAFENLKASVNMAETLPEQVFLGDWQRFLFCESDRIFTPSFADIANNLISLEGAQSCCLINLDLTASPEFNADAMLFLEESLTGAMYTSSLKRGGPSSGWFYSMHRYGCASNIGEWCIYCEKMNDIAVIGLRYPGGGEKFASPLGELRAHPIDAFLEMGLRAPIPFNKLVDHWRNGLIKNYSRKLFQGNRG